MDFALSQQHKMVQTMVREFAETQIAPIVQSNDEFASYNRAVLSKMGEAGILGICLPKQFGGSGYDYVSLAVACEELERVDLGARITITIHLALNSMSLLQWGTEEQKQRLLIPSAKGLLIGSFAVSEQNAGTYPSNVETIAEKKGDHYILNGTKLWVSLAEVADYFIVLARLKNGKGTSPLGCFIVERGFKGVNTGSISGKMNVRIGNTGKLMLTDVRVPIENLLGEEGEGLKVALTAIDRARYTVAAGAVGVTQACLEASVKYARVRQIPHGPIGKMQLVQQMIANMVLGVETARSQVYRVGWLMNKGMRCTQETALAKWYACDVSFHAASDAMEIHGASAYLNDLPLERYLRNTKGSEIYTGTREILQTMLGEYALGYRTDKPLRQLLPRWPFEMEDIF